MQKTMTFLVVFLLLVACQKVDIKIVPIGDKQVGVGQTLVFDVCVTGAGSETVTFTFEAPSLPSSGAQLTPYQNDCATFRWTPRSEHSGIHSFTFRAGAGGSSDTETIAIEVTGSSSAPVFLQPGAGGTYDLTRDPCVNVHIEVKDDDSLPQNVTISERDPRIEGGEMTVAGKTADWRWCPSPQQIEANDRYTLLLQAQDEAHVPVPHDFVIVLRGVTRPDCPGAAPMIQSNYPPPPDLVASNRDYAVNATITDDQGIKEQPILYYSFDPPANPDKPDVTAFSQALFDSLGGDAYVAYIPNQGLAEGETKTVYYVISVTDNDDAEGVLCDHRVDSALFQFNITGGTEAPGAYCERCSQDSQCASGGCVVTAASYCGGSCADCAALGGVCQDVTVVSGAVMNLCVPASGTCGGSTTCTDDTFEDNDTSATARAVTADVYTGLMICPRDEDFYAINITQPSNINVVIDGWDASTVDIDLQLRRPDGSIMDTSASLDASEEVEGCGSASGNYIVRVYGIIDDSGPYSMLVDVSAGTCCTNDGYEPNDSATAARTITDPSSPVSGTICPSDNDWFKVHANAGQKLIADLTMTGGDLDLELYDTDGLRRVAYSMNTGTTPEHAEYDITVSGDYYVRVKGWLSATGDYTLQISFGSASGCTDTYDCPVGRVCDGSTCIDDSCTPPDGCPLDHLCPTPGGSETISDCVDWCTSSSECRDGYACKTFPEGNGCAGTGYGEPGDACFSFRSCKGEMTCMNAPAWPSGYCAKRDCLSNDDCPSGSYCVDVTGFIAGLCVKDCLMSDDLCRLSAGYRCECARDIDDNWQWVCLAPGATAPSCF